MLKAGTHTPVTPRSVRMDNVSRHLHISLAFVLAVSVLATSATEVRTPYGTIHLEPRTARGTANALSGKFTAHSGEGIRFSSSEDHLSISSLEGELILLSSRTVRGSEEFGYYNVLGQKIVEAESRGYAVPHNKRINVQNLDVSENWQELITELQEQSEEEHTAIIQGSYQDLVSSPQALLIVHAAEGLGENLGVMGNEEPAILPFYTVALRLAKARDQEEELVDNERNFETMVQRYPNCNLRSCPPCRNDHCMGMCGRRCSCWRWVCGNCCFHRGCATHDVCCRRRGFYSWACARIGLGGWGFSCNGNYNC